MIMLEPPNFAPTDAEVRTTRLVLEFSRREHLNGYTAAKGRADMEGVTAVSTILAKIVDIVEHTLEGADDFVTTAVERYDSRIDGRPGKEPDDSR